MKFQGKWQPETEEFKKRCLELSQDLVSFKRDPVFVKFIGNDIRKRDVAQEFFNYISDKYRYLLQFDYSLNDIIGDPFVYEFEGDLFSPATLRFIKVIGDINKYLGDVRKIVEIGSGYGGQALVFSLIQQVNYTCIDIPECLQLAKNYHHTLGWNDCRYVDTNSIKKEKYDLCISDYCLGELDGEGIDFYLTNVVSQCKYAYITVNRNTNVFEDLTRNLVGMFSEVEVKDEEPKTSRHNNCIIYCKN